MPSKIEEKDPIHIVALLLLGGIVLIRCKYQYCAQQIADYFSASTSDLWCSPDIIVDCEWSEINNYLFRSRPADDHSSLKGIRVHIPDQWSHEEWSFTDPPIPPFILPPFKDRFVGMHGAALGTPNGGGVLLLGKRGSGKSTLAIELVNNHACRLLTDETIFIHRRTSLVEPFPRPLKVWKQTNDGLCSRIVPAIRICREVAYKSILVSHIIFLEHLEEAEARLIPLQPAEAVKLFLEHHLDLGSSFDETIVTILQLAYTLPAILCQYQSHEERMQLIPQMKKFCFST